MRSLTFLVPRACSVDGQAAEPEALRAVEDLIDHGDWMIRAEILFVASPAPESMSWAARVLADDHPFVVMNAIGLLADAGEHLQAPPGLTSQAIIALGDYRCRDVGAVTTSVERIIPWRFDLLAGDKPFPKQRPCTREELDEFSRSIRRWAQEALARWYVEPALRDVAQRWRDASPEERDAMIGEFDATPQAEFGVVARSAASDATAAVIACRILATRAFSGHGSEVACRELAGLVRSHQATEAVAEAVAASRWPDLADYRLEETIRIAHQQSWLVDLIPAMAERVRECVRDRLVQCDDAAAAEIVALLGLDDADRD